MAYHNHIGDVICPDLLRWQQESRYDAKEDSSHTLLFYHIFLSVLDIDAGVSGFAVELAAVERVPGIV